ncbi:MAG: hypothetical protein Crog4KO_31570 [Crocinitomicaceae bacterium]
MGLFSNTPESYDGYTLFAPMSGTTTYLINNCGEKVHSWNSAYEPALSVYLLENGTLLRTGTLDNLDFDAGGSGGVVEMIDWNGNVIWEYTVSSTTECQHHDVEYLPNGNVLIIVWDLKTTVEADQAGRTTMGASVWSEKIIEVTPDYTTGSGGTIVWEWQVWDHLVQDADAQKDNYGDVGNSPELIDINYTTTNLSNEDWLHFNSIDYNPELDQIVLSTRSNCEIWIIDHSTTTAEAAGHTGGNSGKGGDLLYRWGNPDAYDQGTSSDQQLYSQHDAQWIPTPYPNGGKITVYNNQAGDAVGQNYSEITMIETPVDGSGNYQYLGGAYTPAAAFWTYQASNPTDFYSAAISGTHALPNGNVLICEGSSGHFFEVDDSGNIVWDYVNPVLNGVPANQEDVVSGNNTFRCTRYSANYGGLTGQSLTPQGYIESGSTFSCELYSTANVSDISLDALDAFPNPAKDVVHISAPQTIEKMQIYNSNGAIVYSESPVSNTVSVQIVDLPAGLYLVRANLSNGQTLTKKLVKD